MVGDCGDGRVCTSTIPSLLEGSASVDGRVAIADTFVHPRFDLGQQPRHTIGTEPYPLREFAGLLKARDVLGRIRDATHCLQLLLGDELLVVTLSHRISPFREASRCLGLEQAAPVGGEKILNLASTVDSETWPHKRTMRERSPLMLQLQTHVAEAGKARV